MAKKGKADADQATGDELVARARGLAEIVSEHNLTELIIDTAGTTITVRREAPGFGTPAQMQYAAPQYPAPQYANPANHGGAVPVGGGVSAPAGAIDDTAHVVTSPFVGTFYRKPNPDTANYVSMGDKVDKGAVLCIVEAMKLMNEIEADAAGTIVAILVEDGSSVEYGQPLFKIAT